MRAKIVLLASEGIGNDRIAARLSVPRQIASVRVCGEINASRRLLIWCDGVVPQECRVLGYFLPARDLRS